MSRKNIPVRLNELIEKKYMLTDAEEEELQELVRNLFGSELYQLVSSMYRASAEYHNTRRDNSPSRSERRHPNLQAAEKAYREYQAIMEAHVQSIDASELGSRLWRLEPLLNDNCSEEDIHTFLAENVSIMLNTPVYDHYLAISKPYLADKYVPDFALYGSCNGPWWTFVEIEKPSDKLFTDNGDYSAKLFHAIRQVHEWQIFINSHFDYYLERFGSDMGFDAHPNFLIVIGRRGQIDREAWQKLNLLNAQGPGGRGFYVATFDFLLDFMQYLEGDRRSSYELRRIRFLQNEKGPREFNMMRALSWPEFQKVRRYWQMSPRFW